MKTKDLRELEINEIEAVAGGEIDIRGTDPTLPETGTGPYAPPDPLNPGDPYHTQYN